MVHCKYLKQKLNRQLECKKMNRSINLSECSNCEFRNLKYSKPYNTLKKVNFKLVEKQKQRFSIIYRTLTFCANCKSKNNIELNEVFEGAKRGVSMTNGFVIPLCKTCHQKFHNDRSFALKYKKLFQAEYEKTHTRDDFIKLIHHNYL